MHNSAIIPTHLSRLMSAADRASLGKAAQLPEEAHTMAVAKSEKQLQGQIEGLLRRHGLIPIRQRMDRKSNVAVGCPDILFAAHGQAVAWEIKLPGQQLRPEQERLGKDMAAQPNGWRVTVITSYQQALEELTTFVDTKP